MLKASQNRMKRADLSEASISRLPGAHHRLVGDHADALAVETDEPDDDVLGEILLDLEEIVVVRNRADDLLHVVGP